MRPQFSVVIWSSSSGNELDSICYCFQMYLTMSTWFRLFSPLNRYTHTIEKVDISHEDAEYPLFGPRPSSPRTVSGTDIHKYSAIVVWYMAVANSNSIDVDRIDCFHKTLFLFAYVILSTIRNTRRWETDSHPYVFCTNQNIHVNLSSSFVYMTVWTIWKSQLAIGHINQ